MIKRAFSPQGIPREILFHSIPKIQEILDELTIKIENNFAIKISKIKHLANKYKEGIFLDAIDIMGERSLDFFSVGQRDFMSVLIKVAIMLYQIREYSHGYRIFIGDEPFSALNTENALKMIELLKGIDGIFNQIIIVSHNDEYLNHFENKMEIKRKGINTEIVRR